MLPEGNFSKVYAVYKDLVLPFLTSLVPACGLPADTLKLTPPALTTCEGVVVMIMSVERCHRTCMYARHMLCVER